MPVDVHCSTSVQTPSRCSHAVHNHQETVHPVVSYKIGYFKHVCTASVFKQVNNLRRKLESGADWASLEVVQELHKLLLDCTTTDQRDAPTGPSSSCSQADTESPRSSPRSSDAEGSRHYPLSDVAVQVDDCFDDLDEWNIKLRIADIDHEDEQPASAERTASPSHSVDEDAPSSPVKKPTRRKLAFEPAETRVSPSRSFWMVTEESRERIRELEATVEALSAEHAAALEQVDAMQRTLARVEDLQEMLLQVAAGRVSERGASVGVSVSELPSGAALLRQLGPSSEDAQGGGGGARGAESRGQSAEEEESRTERGRRTGTEECVEREEQLEESLFNTIVLYIM